MPKQVRHKTKYVGVYYIEGRGRDGRPENIFYITFRKDGKLYEEKAGRSREDAMTAAKAARIRGERIQGQRKSRQEIREEEEGKKTLSQIFKQYLPASKASKRSAASWKREDSLFRLWIEPVMGDKLLDDIAPIHLERVKADMAKAGRAPASIKYALAVIRQVFNWSRLHGIYDGPNPVSKVKKPSVVGNQRLRYLTHDEAERLLSELAARSVDVHDQALLSLHCGLRFGEIANLQWGDVDMQRGALTLKDTKSGRSRIAFMTERVKAMLEGREHGSPTELVFPARGGKTKKQVQISDSFNRAVKVLGLNEGIQDRRQRVVFHSLRHTYASWMVEAGVDLYLVKELLGHQNFSMTSRYAHVGPSSMQAAVRTLEVSIEKEEKRQTATLHSKK